MSWDKLREICDYIPPVAAILLGIFAGYLAYKLGEWIGNFLT